MCETPAEGRTDGGSFLDAYQLLLEAAHEAGDGEELLRRALTVIATVPWRCAHRSFSAFLPEREGGALRPVALVGVPSDPAALCGGGDPRTCVCGRAFAAGRTIAGDGARAPCEQGLAGSHIVVPLASSGRVYGVLHALLAAGCVPLPAELFFLERAGSLLGFDLQGRGREAEHQQLELRFLQAQRMEAVGRLAGGVAHDFNNILTAITSYSELGLLKIEPGHPLRRNFEEILAAADRAARLTQQLLAFSRRQPLAPRPVQPGALLAEIGPLLRRLLGADVELVLRTETDLPRIQADPAQFEQAITNLAVGARDAMPHGGRFTIEAARASVAEPRDPAHPGVTPGDYLLLSVSDTSTAADGEKRRRRLEALLEPGEPVADGDLGLVATAGIVQRGGGKIAVCPGPGAGTVLRLYFPALAGDSARTAGARGSETILLAEDDDSVRCVIVEHLRDLGYRVLETREGREALEAAADAAPIDLLLADVVMPGMSGVELHRHLLQRRPGLRVLYVSGCGDNIIALHGITEPDTQLLHKPFTPAALAERVRQALDTPA